jgi:hypothetical protein
MASKLAVTTIPDLDFAGYILLRTLHDGGYSTITIKALKGEIFRAFFASDSVA